MEPLPYDGIGEMYFRNIDDWIALQKTPAFANLASKLAYRC